jgi:hypothetical protein
LSLTSNIFDAFICSPASLQDGHCHIARKAIQGQACKDEEINIKGQECTTRESWFEKNNKIFAGSQLKLKPKPKKVPKHATVEDDDGESDSGESDSGESGLGGPEVESSDPGEMIRYPVRHGMGGLCRRTIVTTIRTLVSMGSRASRRRMRMRGVYR